MGETPKPTDDQVLDKIAAWCDEHGWDALDSPEFLAWLQQENIDRNSLMITKCHIPKEI